MNNPDTWLAIATIISLALIGAGIWIFHRKVRTRASLGLVCSFAALIGWFSLLSPILELWHIGSAKVQGDKALLNTLYILDAFAIPALLLLACAVTFFMAMRSLKPAA